MKELDLNTTIVSDVIYYSYNRFDKDEALRMFGERLGEHYWAKFLVCERHIDSLFAQIDKEHRQKFVEEALKYYGNATTHEGIPNVSIYERDGVKYVRVKVCDYDFLIDLHDAPEEMNWDKAMEYAKSKNMTLFDKKQAHLIFALFGKINRKLVEAGGEPIKYSPYWTCAEDYCLNVWYVYFASGDFFTNYKRDSNMVRAVAAF